MKALEYLQKSKEKFEKLQNRYRIAQSYLFIGDIYVKTKQYKKALDYTLKSISIIQELELLKELSSANLQLSEIYAATNNYEKAYLYYKVYKNLNDSIFNEENIKKITSLENRYKFEKEKEAIAIEQAKKDSIKAVEMKRQKVIRNLLIAGFGLMMLFALFIIRSLAQKRKANLQLAARFNEVKMLNETKDNILSVISHDLRGPVGTLKSFVDMIYKNVNNYTKEEIESFIGLLSKQSSSVYTILNNLLLWANSQRKNIKYQPEKQLVMNAVADNVALLEAIATRKEITIQNNILETFEATFDNDLISTVVRNLINNAIKFTPKGGIVSIDAFDDGQYHTVVVTDTGIGISKERADAIFDKTSYQTTFGTDNEKGSGLGLKLCYEFIEKHDGKIWVESEEGKGSKFYFSLPKQ